MHRCECNYWNCAKLVSRRTWFRHKMAMILEAQSAESVPNSAPLPVEVAAPAAVDVQHEVHIINIILTIKRKSLQYSLL